jgi:2'-5' RNA ligase
MTTFRGFIAIDITPTKPIQEILHEIQLSHADVKLVDPNNIHITLKFLGDVDQSLTSSIIKILDTAVQQITRFSIDLQGSGVFPNQNYIKVVWIGIQPTKELPQLVTYLENKLEPLGFKKESRSFSPHLTIGRVRTPRNKPQLLGIISQYQSVQFGQQNISTIYLKQSTLTPQGPIYTTLHEAQIV